MALEVVAGRCAELAVVVFAGVFFAAGFFFAEAEGVGFAVFFAARGDEAAPAAAAVAGGAFATRLVAGHSRQVKTAATQYKVFLSSIASRSNHWLRSGPRGTRAARARRPQFNCKPRSAFVARDAEKGTS